jgi:hypothetical protein
MEYWDGTKSESLSHAETINDQLESKGKKPTQDTSRFFWKSEEELYWELMGSCGEKSISRFLKLFVNDLKYLTCRSNPDKGFDRTKQYEFQAQLIQEHVNKLSMIVKAFLDDGRRLRPVQYAIELLTREGVYIDELCVEKVATKLSELHVLAQQDEDNRRYEKEKKLTKAMLPGFIRTQIRKDELNGFTASFPFGKMQSSITAKCGMERGKMRNGKGQNAESIPAKRRNRFPQNDGIDSRNLGGAITEITNRDYSTEITHKAGEEGLNNSLSGNQAADPTAALSTLGDLTQEEVAIVLDQILTHRQLQAMQNVAPSSEDMRSNFPRHMASPTSEETPSPPVVSESEQAVIMPASETQTKADEELLSGSGPILVRPESNAMLTDEVIVQLWEYLREVRYDDQRERASQLQAARILLGLRLPLSLSVDLLECVYTTYFDDFWRRKYGELHLTHVVDTERSGQRRIVRWLHRLKAQTPVMSATAETVIVQENLPTETNGFNGYGPERLIEWKGRLVSEAQAYQEGYEGGFERFVKGDHPDDDLEAAMKRLQAEGKLPVFERVGERQ